MVIVSSCYYSYGQSQLLLLQLLSEPALIITVMVRASSCYCSYDQSHFLLLQLWSEPVLPVTVTAHSQLLLLQLWSEPTLVVTVMVRASSYYYNYDKSQLLLIQLLS